MDDHSERQPTDGTPSHKKSLWPDQDNLTDQSYDDLLKSTALLNESINRSARERAAAARQSWVDKSRAAAAAEADANGEEAFNGYQDARPGEVWPVPSRAQFEQEMQHEEQRQRNEELRSLQQARRDQELRQEMLVYRQEYGGGQMRSFWQSPGPVMPANAAMSTPGVRSEAGIVFQTPVRASMQQGVASIPPQHTPSQLVFDPATLLRLRQQQLLGSGYAFGGVRSSPLQNMQSPLQAYSSASQPARQQQGFILSELPALTPVTPGTGDRPTLARPSAMQPPTSHYEDQVPALSRAQPAAKNSLPPPQDASSRPSPGGSILDMYRSVHQYQGPALGPPKGGPRKPRPASIVNSVEQSSPPAHSSPSPAASGRKKPAKRGRKKVEVRSDDNDEFQEAAEDDGGSDEEYVPTKKAGRKRKPGR